MRWCWRWLDRRWWGGGGGGGGVAGGGGEATLSPRMRRGRNNFVITARVVLHWDLMIFITTVNIIRSSVSFIFTFSSFISSSSTWNNWNWLRKVKFVKFKFYVCIHLYNFFRKRCSDEWKDLIIISDIREEVEAGNTDQRSDGKSFTVWNYSVTALNEILGIFVAGTKHDFFCKISAQWSRVHKLLCHFIFRAKLIYICRYSTTNSNHFHLVPSCECKC